MLYWKAPSPRGYMGPQVTATRLISGEPQQVLFSLWDKDPGEDTWLPAIPDHENCNRNCNDCGVHVGDKVDDGSTGTQCKVFIPRYANQVLRMRVRRVEAEGSREMYGQTFTGGVWEVTVQDLGTGEVWTVGRQLLAEQFGGIVGTSAFNEHIGCTPCDAFDQSEVRGGPWVLEPPGTTLVGATSRYTLTREDGFTCHRHAVTSDGSGVVTFASGPSSAEQPGSGAWDKTLYSCDGDGGCATPPLVAWPPSSPPASPAPSPPANAAARRGRSRLRRAGEEPRQYLLDAVPVRRGGGGRCLVRVDVHVFTRILGQLGVPLLRGDGAGGNANSNWNLYLVVSRARAPPAPLPPEPSPQPSPAKLGRRRPRRHRRRRRPRRLSRRRRRRRPTRSRRRCASHSRGSAATTRRSPSASLGSTTRTANL